MIQFSLIQFSAPLFTFLAATVVAVFSFLSIAIWITTPAKERQVRDRLALLKTIAEQPGENAARVLSLLQQDDEERAARRERAERRSWFDSGIILIAIGVGLIAMLISRADVSAWSVGLIPLLLGLSMILIGVLRGRSAKRGNQ